MFPLGRQLARISDITTSVRANIRERTTAEHAFAEVAIARHDLWWRRRHHRCAGRAANTALPLPCAGCRRKTELPAEVALDGLDLAVLQLEIIDVPERLAVLRPAKIFHERLVAFSEHLLHVEPLDEINLRLPAPCLESAFANVIVVVRARKSEVVGQQNVERAPLLLLPPGVVFPDDVFVRLARSHSRSASLRRVRLCRPQQARPSSQRASACFEQTAARHRGSCHDAFSFPWSRAVMHSSYFFAPGPRSRGGDCHSTCILQVV